MEVYTDVNYAGSVIDRRSASNYYTFVWKFVDWRSKKQNVVKSHVEEFKVMALGFCEQLWMKQVLEDLKILCENPMKLLWQ